MLPNVLIQTLKSEQHVVFMTYFICVVLCSTPSIREEKGKQMRSSYLEGAAITVELTAHLSFGTVMLVT